MKIALLIILALTTTFASFAGRINGKVSDATTSKGLEFVKVTLFKKDSTVQQGTYSDVNGNYILGKVPSGSYYIQYSFFEYEDMYVSDIIISATKPTVKFEHVLNKIDVKEGVEVVAETPIFETKIDKKVYDATQDLSAQGGTATDLLRNVPSVEVDENGNVSLRGNANVTILLDGLPSNLTAGNLEAIPANSIEKVELVTNPSAKYDPDGTVGIINIVLKKSKLRGVNGSVGVNLGTGGVINGNASFNARNDKINFFASYGFRHYEGFRNNFSFWDTDLGDTLYELNQIRYGTDLSESQNLRVGMDFILPKKQTLGFSVNGNLRLRERTGNQENNEFYNSNFEQSRLRLSRDPINTQNLDFSVNYRKKFKPEKGQLKFNGNQSFGNNNTEGFYDETYTNQNGVEYRAPFAQEIINKSKTNVTTLALDVEYLLNKNKKIEYGAKFIKKYLDKDAFSESFDTVSMSFKPDVNLNNRFVYDENLMAVYGIYGEQINKFGYQVGLRLEQALTEPRLITTGENFENNYFSFFPSAAASYKLTKSFGLNLTYSRRINRPSARTLNPFPSFSDPLNLRVGNPALQPEYINSFDLGTTKTWKKFTLTTSLYYRHLTDRIQRIKEFYDDGTSAVTYHNLDNSSEYGLELIGIVKPFKWWKNVVSVNGYNVQFQNTGTQSNINNGGYSWHAKLNSTFTLFKKTTTLQFTTAYLAPRITAQGTATPRRGLDISVQRRFLNKKLTVGVKVEDVFNTKGFTYEVVQGNLTQSSEFKWLTRRFFVNISYRFGKLEMGKDRNRNSGGGGASFDF